METVLLQDYKFNFPQDLEAHSLRSAMLFSKVSSSGNLIISLYLTESLKLYDEQEVYKMHIHWLRSEANPKTDEHEKYYRDYCKKKAIKHKSKEVLISLEKSRKYFREVKELEIKKYEKSLIIYKVDELKKFIRDEELLCLQRLEHTEKTTFQTYLQIVMMQALTENENILAIHEYYTKNSTIASLDTLDRDSATNSALPDILFIPFIELPDTSNLNYEQVKYTRDNIIKILKDFDAEILKTKEKISHTHYKAENITELRQCISSLSSTIPAGLQQMIDNEIYIVKSKNDNDYGQGIRIGIAITSCGHIFDIMEKGEITESFNLNTIKTHFEKIGSPAQTIIFLILQQF